MKPHKEINCNLNYFISYNFIGIECCNLSRISILLTNIFIYSSDFSSFCSFLFVIE